MRIIAPIIQLLIADDLVDLLNIGPDAARAMIIDVQWLEIVRSVVARVFALEYTAYVRGPALTFEGFQAFMKTDHGDATSKLFAAFFLFDVMPAFECQRKGVRHATGVVGERLLLGLVAARSGPREDPAV